MDGFHLAQLNIGRLHHPLDADETAEFPRVPACCERCARQTR